MTRDLTHFYTHRGGADDATRPTDRQMQGNKKDQIEKEVGKGKKRVKSKIHGVVKPRGDRDKVNRSKENIKKKHTRMEGKSTKRISTKWRRDLEIFMRNDDVTE